MVKHHRLEFTPVKREAPLATFDNVSIDISVVLGRTAMPIHQVLRLRRGAIIEFDSSEDDEVRTCQQHAGGARHGHRQRQSHRGGSQRAAAPLARSRLIRCCAHSAVAGPACLGVCGGDNTWSGGIGASGLVRAQPSCYIRAVARRFRHAPTPHAVVAELVDALA